MINLIYAVLLLTVSAALVAAIGLLAARDLQRELVQAVAERDSARSELRRLRQKRHTHQTAAMLDDLSAVHLDILGELKIFYRRMGALLARLQPFTAAASEAAQYHHEFCTYTRARLRAVEAIMHAGRRGPYSYIPPAAIRPDRPGAGKRG